MSDGTIVTENEVVAFCPGIDTLADDTPDGILLPMIEASVKDFLKRDLTATDYVTDISVKRELVWHHVLIQPRDTFFTEDFPVNTWTKLEKVVSRDDLTGDPDQLQLIPRDTYFVDLKSGVIRLLRSLQDIELRPVFSFPTGVASMIATYNAGFAVDSVPPAVKLVTLMRFKRFKAMMDQAAWNLKMVVNPTGGETSYLRVDWTPEEKGMLEPFVRHSLVLGAF